MKAAKWCTDAIRRLVPIAPARVALFCSLLALASLRCISDFFVAPGGTATGDAPPPPASPPRIEQLTLQPDKQELKALGDTFTVSVDARAAGGLRVAAPPLEWQSSDNAVATVSPAGLVTARGNGEAEITARAGAIVASVAVAVRQEVARVTIEPALLVLPLFQSRTLTATAHDRNGFAVVDHDDFDWNSSKSRTVSVSPEDDESRAVVRRLRSGEVTITATTGGMSGSATVR